MKFRLILLAALSVTQYQLAAASPRVLPPASITSLCKPISTPKFLLPEAELRRRQITANDVTCGFSNGDAKEPRTADPGFDCRVDTKDAIWGFCPTTVVAATDCGLAAYCQDSALCTSGCGLSGRPDLTSITWCVIYF